MPKLPIEDIVVSIFDTLILWGILRSWTVNWFAVRVPVLSVQRMSTPANDSMAVNFCTMACLRARKAAPTAKVVVVTHGRPTGTPIIYFWDSHHPKASDNSDTHQENQCIDKKIVGLGSSEVEVMEEATDPYSKQPQYDTISGL